MFTYEMICYKWGVTETEIYTHDDDENNRVEFITQWKYWTANLLSEQKLTEEEISKISENENQEWDYYDIEFTGSYTGDESIHIDDESLQEYYDENFPDDTYDSWQFRDHIEDNGWGHLETNTYIEGKIQLKLVEQ